MSSLRRRSFLKSLGGGLAGSVAGWSSLTPVARALEDIRVTPEKVRLQPEMEGVVRWIEQTPRARIFDVAVRELQKGLSYRQLLAGLFLAGIRNIKPRPVGFKFHAVMVIESAHQLALDAPRDDRLLPFFWALDNFKRSQAEDVREGDWRLGPVKEAEVPPAGKARAQFVEAMERWDEEAADAAVAGLYRAVGAAEVMELLWPYGARDWRNIGHKIIFTAHSFRTLETIGWQHAEPVLRSLVYGLLNGSRSDTALPYQSNLEALPRVRPTWPTGKPDRGATKSMLDSLRHAEPHEAASEAIDLVNRGVAASSVWDAVMLMAGELVLRQPGIVTLHAMTASNSLHYAYQASGKDSTRILTLLQAVSWLTLFREATRQRDGLPQHPRIDSLEPAGEKTAPTVEAIFADLSKDRVLSARQVLAYARENRSWAPFLDTARQLTLSKGTDAHHYKFAAAVFEEALKVSPHWQPQILAASTSLLRSAAEPDSPLLKRTREALQKV